MKSVWEMNKIFIDGISKTMPMEWRHAKHCLDFMMILYNILCNLPAIVLVVTILNFAVGEVNNRTMNISSNDEDQV